VPGERRGLARAHQGLEKFGTASTIDALVRVPAKGARPRVRGPVWPGLGGMVLLYAYITLALQADGAFTWDVANKSQRNQSIHGRAVYVNSVLSLTQEEGPPLTGKIESKDAGKFTFRLMGGGNNAPALTFTR
jgi:hypothetical protein